jgi:hypothetical protein
MLSAVLAALIRKATCLYCPVSPCTLLVQLCVLPLTSPSPAPPPPPQVAKPVFQSKMPGMDPSRASLLKPEDAARLDRERAVVAEKEAALYGAQNEVALEKQRAEVFREALQEVALFKSRMDVALLQAQEQAGRLQNEAEQLQKRYQQAYLGARQGGCSAAPGHSCCCCGCCGPAHAPYTQVKVML